MPIKAFVLIHFECGNPGQAVPQIRELSLLTGNSLRLCLREDSGRLPDIFKKLLKECTVKYLTVPLPPAIPAGPLSLFRPSDSIFPLDFFEDDGIPIFKDGSSEYEFLIRLG
jgi:hypothetical protein